jgi:cell division protein FtsB
MTETERKALALLNECGWGGAHLRRTWNPRYEALCRAIEQLEAENARLREEVQSLTDELAYHGIYPRQALGDKP